MKHSEYRGHIIDIDGEGHFDAIKNGEVIAHTTTLDELKKAIDRVMKQAFVQRPVIIKTGERLVTGKITSARLSRYSRTGKDYEFRVTFPQKSRSYSDTETTSWEDESASNLYKDTAENQKKMEDYNKLQDDMKRLAKEAEKIYESLEAYTEKELLGE